jgi:glycerol-3-phosphate O-acyltransferase
MFLEKQRSRSGKIQQPRNVLFDFTIQNFLNGELEIPQKKDIKFVPITINYDRVYEGETFPLELLGETKQQETFWKMLKQFNYSNKQFGRVSVKYCQPISLKGYIQEQSH